MRARAWLCGALSAAAVLAAGSALAAPQYLAYEGLNAVRVGDGGEKKTVGGIDIWMNGAPPRRFEVLGSLTDRRTGLLGMPRLADVDREIADAAKKAGGDAVILASQGDAALGVVGFDTASDYGRHASATRGARFVVVKYLKDTVATPDAEPYPGLTPDGRVSGPGPDLDLAPSGAVARY